MYKLCCYGIFKKSTSNAFLPKVSKSGQYRCNSFISEMLFFNNLGYLNIYNCSSLIAMYLVLVKTEMDFHDRVKNIMLQKEPIYYNFGR